MVEIIHSSGRYSADQTVFLWSRNEQTRKVVQEVCERRGLKVFDATVSESSDTDWIAVPYFVRVLDADWYLAHQDEILEHHQNEADRSTDVVIGNETAAIRDSEYLVEMTTAEHNWLDRLISREKTRYDEAHMV